MVSVIGPFIPHTLSNTLFVPDPLLGAQLPSGLPLSLGGSRLVQEADTFRGNQEQRGLGAREEVTGPTQGEDSYGAPEEGQHLSWPRRMSRMGTCGSPAGKEG